MRRNKGDEKPLHHEILKTAFLIIFLLGFYHYVTVEKPKREAIPLRLTTNSVNKGITTND